MSHFKVISISTFLLASLMFSKFAIANAPIKSQEFVDIASVRSISEVETAKIALAKSASPDVKAYAQVMIVEQTAAIESLRVWAKEQNLQMFSEAELQDKARVYIFQRNGKAFDAAYIEMRTMERRKAVSLFRAAAESDDAALKQYATAGLPSLMHKLYMAQSLAKHVDNKELLADR